jgi:phosphate-selective porin OprO and OprP
MSQHSVKQLAKLAAVSATILAASVPAGAQTVNSSSSDEIQALREQIMLLQQRLDSIEQREAAQAAAAKTAAAAPAQAQAPAAKPAPDSVKATLGQNSIVAFTTEDKRYSFMVKTRLQVDAHFFPELKDGSTDLYLRRALITFKGKADALSWTLTPNLAGSSVTVDDAWLEYSISDAIHPWLGRMPTLEGWEMYQSNGKTLFIERGLPSNLSTGRENGVMVTGTLANNVLTYGVAVVDGALDTNTQLNNANLSGDMDLVGRISITPFVNAKNSPLAGLTFTLSGSFGRENTTIDGTTDKTIKYKTSGRNTFLTIQNGVVIDGDRHRIGPQFSYFYGSFGLMGEYMVSAYEMNRGGRAKDIENTGWTVQGSYVLTGEKATAAGVKPAKPFSLKEGTWGAFELGVRYNEFNGDEALFGGTSSQLLATSSSTQKAAAYGLALKWYLTENLLWAWNYENTDFSGKGADRGSEQVIMTRVQVEF